MLTDYQGNARITPVILSGGSGTRLWPVSRETAPKQFQPLQGGKSLFRQTLARVSNSELFTDPVIVANARHRDWVAHDLAANNVHAGKVILEPVARNTAMAIALAALLLWEEDPDGIMLVLPSDHLIDGLSEFLSDMLMAAVAANCGYLTTFGIRARTPETGFGYIKRGAGCAGAPGAHLVEAFVEKPDLATAAGYVRDGQHDWNSGMFMFRVSEVLAELTRHAPEIIEAASNAMRNAEADGLYVSPATTALEDAPNVSIDNAVMELTSRAAVVSARFEWSDLGSFDALWESSGKDQNGNALNGDVIASDSRNNYVQSSGRLIATIGVEDLVVVDTPDALLVTRKDRCQEVKGLVGQLNDQSRQEAELPAQVRRPWGTYQSVHTGDHFQVKHIVVAPGGQLSLQRHFHRAEHWVVVAGCGRVTIDDNVQDVSANNSVFIPRQSVHRVENPFDEPLHLIEVQYGAYLGEDDIERIEDVYGRVAATELENAA